MSGDKRIIYWDACVFIAWVKNERRAAGQMAGLRSCIPEIESGKWNLITSSLCVAEVLESNTGKEAREKFLALFGRPNITALDVDIRVADKASYLRNYYVEAGSDRKLATPDALHLATAIIYGAEEFHTWDDGKSDKKYLGLLELSGNVAGHRLIILPPGDKGQQLLDYGQENNDPDGQPNGDSLESAEEIAGQDSEDDR